MINNIHIIERLVDNELSAARAEGMRSQMLAREDLIRRVKLPLPDVRGFFHRVTGSLFSHSQPPCVDETPAR